MPTDQTAAPAGPYDAGDAPAALDLLDAPAEPFDPTDCAFCCGPTFRRLPNGAAPGCPIHGERVNPAAPYDAGDAAPAGTYRPIPTAAERQADTPGAVPCTEEEIRAMLVARAEAAERERDQALSRLDLDAWDRITTDRDQARAELAHVGQVLTDWRQTFTDEPHLLQEADQVLVDLIDGGLLPTAEQPMPPVRAALGSPAPRAQEPQPGRFCTEHWSWLCQAGQGRCQAAPRAQEPADDLAARADRIAQAIGDPGSIAGPRVSETLTRWSTRAVLLVLAEETRRCQPATDEQPADPDPYDHALEVATGDHWAIHHPDTCTDPADCPVIRLAYSDQAALVALPIGRYQVVVNGLHDRLLIGDRIEG